MIVKLNVHQKTKLCLIKQGKLQPLVVIQYDKKNNEIKRYPSLVEASESTNISYTNIQS